LHPWIYEHYVEPIMYDTGYNPANTLTWALILGLMLFVIIKLFRYLDLRLDESLVYHTIPYILAGSSLRVIEDAGILAPPLKYLLITPLIYFVVALVSATSLLLCRKFVGEGFLKSYAYLGLAWTALNLALLLTYVEVENAWAPAVIFALGSALTLVLWLLRSHMKLSFLERRGYLLILYSHMLDASSTYIGVNWMDYYEKHVVPSYLIDLTGTALVMYPLKLVILIPVLSLIDTTLQEDTNLRNMAKLALLTLGLAPAMRNTIRLTLGI